jgi:4-hydroxy-tetrahydrodipicolinate reductase
MTSPIKIAVAGALGHMGTALVSAVAADPSLVLVGAFGRPGGAMKPGMVDVETALKSAEVVIDFTNGQASAALATACADGGGPALVIGSTGFEPSDLAQISAAARKVAIVRSGNFSLGLNLLTGMVTRASRVLGAEAWDVEIFEAHHRRKADAPSGTALMLGEAVASGRGVALSSVQQRARDGITSERPIGEIGFSVLRAGGIVGEHSVVFAAADEILTFAHSARDRNMFARSAMAAARWIACRQPGEYDMQDVLGLSNLED